MPKIASTNLEMEQRMSSHLETSALFVPEYPCTCRYPEKYIIMPAGAFSELAQSSSSSEVPICRVGPKDSVVALLADVGRTSPLLRFDIEPINNKQWISSVQSAIERVLQELPDNLQQAFRIEIPIIERDAHILTVLDPAAWANHLNGCPPIEKFDERVLQVDKMYCLLEERYPQVFESSSGLPPQPLRIAEGYIPGDTCCFWNNCRCKRYHPIKCQTCNTPLETSNSLLNGKHVCIQGGLRTNESTFVCYSRMHIKNRQWGQPVASNAWVELRQFFGDISKVVDVSELFTAVRPLLRINFGGWESQVAKSLSAGQPILDCHAHLHIDLSLDPNIVQELQKSQLSFNL